MLVASAWPVPVVDAVLWIVCPDVMKMWNTVRHKCMRRIGPARPLQKQLCKEASRGRQRQAEASRGRRRQAEAGGGRHWRQEAAQGEHRQAKASQAVQ